MRKQIEETKKNENEITLHDIKAIYKDMFKKGFNTKKMSIVGLNTERLTTIQSFDEDEVRVRDKVFNEFDEDY